MMKKAILVLLIGLGFKAQSQSTLYNEYDAIGSMQFRSFYVQGDNKLYLRYDNNKIVKTNLNGTPISLTSFSYPISDPVYYNGSLYATTVFSVSPNVVHGIVKLDTGNLSVTKAWQLNTPNNNLFLNAFEIYNNKLYITGQAQPIPFTSSKGAVISVDLVTETVDFFNVVGPSTGTTQVSYSGLKFLQNGSVILPGYHTGWLLTRATINSSGINIQESVGGASAQFNNGIINIGITPNYKVLILGTSTVAKIDTTLTALTIANSYSIHHVPTAVYRSGKLFSVKNGSVLTIHNENLNFLNENSYSFLSNMPAFGGYNIDPNSICASANNLYFSAYGYCSGPCQTAVLVKADTNGIFNCSSPIVSNYSTTPVNNVSAVNFTVGTAAITITSVTPATPSNIAVPSYTTHCLTATSIKSKNMYSGNAKLYHLENSRYKLEASGNIIALGIYDMNGKLILSPELNNINSSKIAFNLTDLTPGIYLMRAREQNGQEYQAKLIHFNR